MSLEELRLRQYWKVACGQGERGKGFVRSFGIWYSCPALWQLYGKILGWVYLGQVPLGTELVAVDG